MVAGANPQSRRGPDRPHGDAPPARGDRALARGPGRCADLGRQHPALRRARVEDHRTMHARPARPGRSYRPEQSLLRVVRREGKSAPRALRLQVHRGGRRCRLPRRPPRRGPPPLHRHHGGPPHDGRGRPLRPEHRLLQVRALAHRLLPDDRARHAPGPAERQAHVPRLRLHRRHPAFRRGEESKFRPPRRKGDEPPEPPEPPERTLQVEGFDVRVTDAGRYIVTSEDGHAVPVTVEEYKQRLAARLVEAAPTVDEFRRQWIVPPVRRDLHGRMPEGRRSALLVRALEDMTAYDLYDVLGELGY